MGPEELAIITNPGFINATFSAGENWFHNLVARAEEAERLARRKNSFEAANAELALVNRELLNKSQEQNARWKRYADGLVANIQALQAKMANDAQSLKDERRADMDVLGRVVDERDALQEQFGALKTETSATISQLQGDLSGARGALTATQSSLDHERRSLSATQTDLGNVRVALHATEGDRQRLQSNLHLAEDALEKAGVYIKALKAASRDNALAAEADRQRLQSQVEVAEGTLRGTVTHITALEAERRDNALAAQAIEAAGMTVMYVTAQAMEAWAAQGKAPMLDNLMTSHAKAGGKPMTMREYLWFATLIKEMKARDVPDHLIRARCPVDGIDDFLARKADVSDQKVALTLL